IVRHCPSKNYIAGAGPDRHANRSNAGEAPEKQGPLGCKRQIQMMKNKLMRHPRLRE
ncbi:Hypothetical predicted protein, partial [Pelobates cultripes]